MLKFQFVVPLSLVLYSSLPPCLAAPSLVCIPKTIASDPLEFNDTETRKPSARRIRVYYVNGHRLWEAKALVVNNHVKAVITTGSLGRPFAKSHIDSNGFGNGIDFRGMPWEFHGFLDP